MKKINVSELQKGTRFTKPLLLDEDNVFIQANTPITEADIAQLNKFGFTEILTKGELVIEAPKDEFQLDDSPTIALAASQAMEIDSSINNLKNLYQQLQKNKQTFEILYNGLFNNVQACYKKIADDKQVEINDIRSLLESIIDFIKSNKNIPYLLLNQNVAGYYLYNQIVHSTILTIFIATILEYSRPKIVDLAIGGIFGDVGMTKISNTILDKKSVLTEDELKVVKTHTLLGYQIITKHLKLKNTLGLIALMHHENFDGTGYPQKLQKNNIDESSRIFSVADSFTALILDRPWRKKILPYEALKKMISVNMNKFDVTIIKTFLNKMAMYPLGSFVELSNGYIGQVIDANNGKPLRPSIIAIKDANGSILRDKLFFNLANDNNINIVKAV